MGGLHDSRRVSERARRRLEKTVEVVWPNSP